MNWRYLAFLFVLVALVGIISCQPEGKEESEVKPPYHMVNLNRHSESCETDSMRCAAVKIEYPEYDSSTADITNRINRSIQEELLKAIANQTEQDARSLEEVALQFFQDYKEFALAEFAMPWTLEVFSDVLMSNDTFFVFALDTYIFTGGAHPNSHRIILNYDLKQGRLLGLKDIILDFAKFSTIAEDIFRKEKGIDRSISLQKAGYLIDDFRLSSQFALTQTGILLFYNTYEIAPYAAGVTEFEIPYRLLDGIVQSDLLPN